MPEKLNKLILKKYLLFTYLLIGAHLIFAQSFIPKGNGQVIDHNYYSLSYMENHEQAEWVYYKLSPEMIHSSVGRSNNFRSDYKVKSGSASLSDYKGSGYDRGHLAPAADMKINTTAMSESFYLSNMSPQHPSFNRGGWKKLEDLVRSWANTEGSVYVVTGPVLNETLGQIGANQVSVPAHYYKVVYAPESKKMIALKLPNQKITQHLSAYVVSVDGLEKETGIDFFHQLDDQLEDRLESSSTAKGWSFTANSTSTYTTNHSSYTSTQCTAIAKSTGEQCKNRTSRPSGYCHVHDHSGSGSYSTSGYSSGRCKATTQAGNQCKRKASSGSSYCWQHQ